MGPIFTFNFLSFLIRRVSGIQNHQLFQDSASCGEGEPKSSCFSFIADYLLWSNRKSSVKSFSDRNSDTLLLMFHFFLWDGMELDVGLQSHHLVHNSFFFFFLFKILFFLSKISFFPSNSQQSPLSLNQILSTFWVLTVSTKRAYSNKYTIRI